ncbi:MAG: uroporphyrinogen decarboxylase [Actinomycetaceae bacterium]|nr:uroporphyrinogen decarboxylase [Actinomycetaceae bacterium]
MRPNLLTALAGKRPEKLPVWFMRQAGRSLPEYRKVRAGIPMLESCLRPELTAEITMQPVRRHDVDAAIFYSDIMVPLKLAGIAVEIEPGVGPVLDHPVRTKADAAKLPAAQLNDPAPIAEAVRLIREELPRETAFLGFAGAPFTLAAYMVEGRPSKDHLRARALMHSDPQTWDRLLSWCAEVSRAFLQVQIDAGVDAVQLFDSWAGSLARRDYQEKVAPYSGQTIAGLEVPVIHFGTQTEHLLDLMAALEVDALGIDHRTDLRTAASIVPDLPLQGNIDPARLFAGPEALYRHVREVVAAGQAAPAHIVNLGHGVPPHADPGVLTELVAYIHALNPKQEK